MRLTDFVCITKLYVILRLEIKFFRKVTNIFLSYHKIYMYLLRGQRSNMTAKSSSFKNQSGMTEVQSLITQFYVL